ncbi:MAG: nucleotidyltransferase domain-containing protein [Methanobrevibacter sp.]|uniref:nucleotidyltransferase domain-containing protein n=1 Tax=Methanobrevibacter TaxID=2172 RepID=UPI0026EB24DA|nr:MULTISPECIES: nucleotidyltransferase domain-containing protein [Methanobrevibacter]MBS7258696.1 nucleotidyltransferase domain-containing protein [Methanobrevibacter sp.]MCI7428881.1 nucleotidyltransferase domain-containing protein [Methanobrevibacter sp.]MDD6775859.1 nucleotidyltransferase domain-containing protein [Methanobacteriaceae archaeon]MDY3096130.1 nucleotidyltransferase domain-containing protein [Methanobrevibacter sp.]
MNNRYEIAREFVEAISSDNIVQTILFGSVARGDDTNESDIDILIIIRSDNRQVEDMIDKMVVDFILEKEEVISPHVMTEDHFNKTKDYSFLKTVMAEGMVI